MLMTLQKSIQKDLSRSIFHIQLQVDDLGDHTDRVERQLTDFTDAYNELVDAHREQANELQRIQAKLADLEDHSR